MSAPTPDLCNSHVSFPVFDSDSRLVLSSSTSSVSHTDVVLCGGGGSARSGVANRIIWATLQAREDGTGGVELKQEASLDTGTLLATSVSVSQEPNSSSNLVISLIENDLCLQRREKDALSRIAERRLEAAQKASMVRFVSETEFLLGCDSGEVLLWRCDLDAASGKRSLNVVTCLVGHVKPIVDLSYMGEVGVSVGQDDVCRVWDLKLAKSSRVDETKSSLLALLPANTVQGMTFRRAKLERPRADRAPRLFAVQVPKGRSGSIKSSVVIFTQKDAEGKSWRVSDEITFDKNVLPTNVALDWGNDDASMIMAVSTADCGVHTFNQTTLERLRYFPKIHGLPVSSLTFAVQQSSKSPSKPIKFVFSTSPDKTCAMISYDAARTKQVSKLRRFASRCFWILLALLVLLWSALLCWFLLALTKKEGWERVREDLRSDWLGLCTTRLAEFTLEATRVGQP